MSVIPTEARTLQVHPSNWVDNDLLTIEVKEGNRFQVPGRDGEFYLEEVPPVPHPDDDPDDDWYAHVFKLRGTEWGPKHSLGTLVVFNRDLRKGSNFTITNMGYEREHADPVGAAVQMICHTV